MIVLNLSRSLTLCLLLALLLVVPSSVFGEELRVLWEEDQREMITILSKPAGEEIRECSEAGLELEQRFLLKFCEKVNRLGTRCGDNLRVIHTLSFDPIQDSYRVSKDILGDTADPVRTTFDTFEDAFRSLSEVESLSLSVVGEEKAFKRFVKSDGIWNLGVRVRTTCKGEFPKFLADISFYLTLGVLDFYGADTGWEYFALTKDEAMSKKAESSDEQATFEAVEE